MATETTTKSPKINLRQKFDTLIYPSDLGKEIWYPEAIKFTILKREGTSIQGAVDAGVNAIKKQINPKGSDKGLLKNLQTTAASALE